MRFYLTHLLLLLIGILGVFLGTLPDSFPSLTNLYSPHNRIEKAFKYLDGSKEVRVILTLKNTGYEEIYKILQEHNRSIPKFESAYDDLKKEMFGRIEYEHGASIGEVKFLGTINYEYPKNGFKPVCSMAELKFLTRDIKIRFWSRLGFALTLFALLFEFILAVRQEHEKKNKRLI